MIPTLLLMRRECDAMYSVVLHYNDLKKPMSKGVGSFMKNAEKLDPVPHR